MKSLQVIDSTALQFVELVRAGIQKWVEAGELVSRKLDEDPEWATKAADSVNGLTVETIMRFDALGRNRLIPQLMLRDCPGFRALSAAPVEIQKRFIDHTIPVIVKTDSGWETLQMKVEAMGHDQVKQVFDRGVVRTESQQRAWIESRKAKANIEIEYHEPFIIRGSKIHFKAGCVMTISELARIIQKASQ